MTTFHRNLTIPGAIHPAMFVQATDPSSDASNNVGPYKFWLDTTNGKISYRNAGNSAWVLAASLLHTDLTAMTSGDPHTQYVTRAALTTKGDLYVATASGVVVRLGTGGAGNDGMILVADSTVTEGMAWRAPSTLTGFVAHVIQNAGSAMTQRPNLDFVGFTVADVPGSSATRVTAPASFANPMTTPADLIVGGTAGAATRLAKGADSQVLTVDPTTHLLVWATPAAPGTGTVTSVALTVPTGFGVTGSPVTSSGTLAVTENTQAANIVKAGPSSGAAATPTYRGLVAADMPAGFVANPMTTVNDIIIGGASGAQTRLAKGTDGQVLTVDPTTHNLLWATPTAITTNQKRMSVAFQFGDGTNAIVAASEREQWIECNFDGTIEGHTLLADVSGSIVVDIWKDTYANYPPTVADTITASAKPTLASAIKAQDTTLTGWTTAITRGDIIKVHIDSASTVKAATLTLDIVKT